jgi:hypothetical protein
LKSSSIPGGAAGLLIKLEWISTFALLVCWLTNLLFGQLPIMANSDLALRFSLRTRVSFGMPPHTSVLLLGTFCLITEADFELIRWVKVWQRIELQGVASLIDSTKCLDEPL